MVFGNKSIAARLEWSSFFVFSDRKNKKKREWKAEKLPKKNKNRREVLKKIGTFNYKSLKTNL